MTFPFEMMTHPHARTQTGTLKRKQQSTVNGTKFEHRKVHFYRVKMRTTKRFEQWSPCA